MVGNKTIKLGALGAGSDWSGFLQFLGIASMDLGFEGEGDGGEYHSIYDSYNHFIKFNDPGFQYGITLSKTTGRTMMRMANADLLPFDFASFHNAVNEYVIELKALIESTRSETEQENKMIRERLFEFAVDPVKNYHSPKIKDAVPFLNFTSLENAMVQLKNSTEKFQDQYVRALQLPVDKRNELNEILYKIERSLINEKGLPRRSWYKHQIYAPGYYSGYSVKTLPGIREAMEQRNWKEAQESIETVAESIMNYTNQVLLALNILGLKAN